MHDYRIHESIIYALNQIDKFTFAIVILEGNQYDGPYYIKNLFSTEFEFCINSINYDLNYLLSKAVAPELCQ